MSILVRRLIVVSLLGVGFAALMSALVTHPKPKHLFSRPGAFDSCLLLRCGVLA